MKVFALSFLLLLTSLTCVPETAVGQMRSSFDEYGGIRWEDEEARLDNFAIQLLKGPPSIGYIFVFNAPEMCMGEAQARAVRAKRYIVEYRGVPENRVIWREEGFRPEIATILYIIPLSAVGSFGKFHELTFDQTTKKSFVVKGCKARLLQIRNSKWQ